MKKFFLLTFLVLISIPSFSQGQTVSPSKDDPSDYWDMQRSNNSLEGGQSTDYRLRLNGGQIAVIAVTTEDRYAEMEYSLISANGSVIASDFANGDTFYFESPRTEEYRLKIENTGDMRGYYTVVLYTSKKKLKK
ncbi:MAG: hypothetical protein IKX22_09510 [Prevotella sp.]|nr:hypothetical protein [Prevotella sp.]